MRSLFLIAVLSLAISEGSLLGYSSSRQELFLYRHKLTVVHDLIATECPDNVAVRRETELANIGTHIEILREQYHRLFSALLKCRAEKSSSNGVDKTTKSNSAGTSAATTKSTAEHVTTATEPVAATTEPLTTTTESVTTTAADQTTTASTTISNHTYKDCQELYENGYSTPGVYKITISNSSLSSFSVWCDFFDNHGWTVIQKRFDGSVDFNRTWNEYKNGFGTIYGEHWLGNDKIHALTRTNQMLNIKLKRTDGTDEMGTWSKFYIADEVEKYKITIQYKVYTGTLRNIFYFHNQYRFSTEDQDNDASSGHSCAANHKGGWWFTACYNAYLNGVYGAQDATAMSWKERDIVSTVMRVTRN